MSRVIGTLLALLALVAIPAGNAATPSGQAARPGGALPHGQTPVLLVFGDSLSAGYGVPIGEGWVDLLTHKIAAEGYDFEVVNASVTGETTAGGLARLPRALAQHHPRILLLELGANDGLRGLPVSAAKANLDHMIRLAQGARAQVLLIGIRLPPNYGPRYTSEFFMMYGALARQHHLALVPFLLDDVALHSELMQADGFHPNAAGEPHVLANVWPTLAPLLAKAQPRAATAH
jgi:acyl-CoA thioesterase-1